MVTPSRFQSGNRCRPRRAESLRRARPRRPAPRRAASSAAEPPAAASAAGAGASPPTRPCSAICDSWRARPPMRPFERAREAGERRRDHADEAAVEHLAGGQAGDRVHLLGRQRLAVHPAALELEQRRTCGGSPRAPWRPRRRRRARTSCAVGPSRYTFRPSAPAWSAARSVSVFLTTRNVRVGLAQARAQLGCLGHRGAAVVDRVDRLRLL